MIENTRILTGTPKEVEPKLAEALAAHPKAEILSSAITAGAEPPDETSTGKKKKAASGVTVMVIVGNRF